MELQQFINDDDRSVHSVRRDGGQTVVADFGPGAGDASVDVVGDTAIVMHGEEQTDIDLPEPVARAFMENGVLTIELEADE
ncbi:hypothetical protein L593_05110 [Salinarchaeum sp. Harcht-Bsk1]|uniref:hypothetical protein n=1 Tax=Salinarchaeum sp. Harcht-Bsk1 TaxID=1333523 RepID=UPI0003422F28|nr:hypothetical protein [Salinarchaeum sp. Harcht-Bsk1]AGN00971.1 hypothetical protein L593_05110 [Salinarchaeum sp. Harcht-Bsk1]